MTEEQKQNMRRKKLRIYYGIVGCSASGSKVVSAKDFDDALEKWSKSAFFLRNPHERQPLTIEEAR
jgi:hypothetical protein